MPLIDPPHTQHCETRPDGSLVIHTDTPLPQPVLTTSCWLHMWAAKRPGAVFLAEREEAGWRELSYAAALRDVQDLGATLLDRGMNSTTPILILSGNGIDHAILALAAQYVGIPITPLPPHCALKPAAEDQLRYALRVIDPAVVFAEDGEAYGTALGLDEMTGRDLVVSRNPTQRMVLLDDWRRGGTTDQDVAHFEVGPDSVVKVLMTSGADGQPKAVRTTHRMMCANQAQILTALPELRIRPPRLAGCLPWSHVTGGSFSFNLVLANGGTIYTDTQTALGGVGGQDLHRHLHATLAVDTPQGFASLHEALQEDSRLCASFCAEMDLLVCTGGALPRPLADELCDIVETETNRRPRVVSFWGLTEAAPACTVQHSPGTIGPPLPEVTLKLVPMPGADARYDIRVQGPNVTSGYHRDPDATRDAVDEEGFLITGDALTLTRSGDCVSGLRFDGRLSEAFKLANGIWVHPQDLRLDLLVHLAGLVRDVVLTGDGRPDVGCLAVPVPSVGGCDSDGFLDAPEIADQMAWRLVAWNRDHASSGRRIARAAILAEQPCLSTGEISPTGAVQARRLLNRRAPLVDRLYGDASAPVIHLD